MALPNSRPPSGGGLPPQRPERPSSQQFPDDGMPDFGRDELRPQRPVTRPEAPSLRPEVPQVQSNSHLSEHDFASKAEDRLSYPPQSDEDVFTPMSVDEIDEADSQEDIDERIRLETERRVAERIKELEREKENAEANARRQAEVEPEPVEEYDEEDEEEEEPEPAPKKPVRKPAPKKKPRGKMDKKGQNVYIDEDKQKLKPFGGRRPKTKVRVNNFDSRNNMRRRAKIIQSVALGLLTLILLFAAKNAIFPPATLTTDDVIGTISETVDITEFPTERGQGFAEDFMKAYLSINSDQISQTVLGYYYTGNFTPGQGDNPNRRTTPSYKQTILYGPTVYGVTPLTNESANYTVAALIQPAPVEGEQPPSDGSSTRWEFFSVNVYYDVATDKFAITPDSPSLLPTPDVLGAGDVPEAEPLGLGDVDDALGNDVRSTVLGFLEGYRTSTTDEHTAIDQYLSRDAGPDQKTGLGGAYEFAGGAENAITWEAYPAENGEVKVAVQIIWQTTVGNENNRNEYISRYVLTLVSGDSGYLVERFAPQYYVPGEPIGDETTETTEVTE